MFYKPEVTATEIADIICRANGLTLADHTTMHNRCRYLAKKELLQDGRKIDARGTLAFPVVEVYRAAIYADLMAIGLDVRAIEAVQRAAQEHSSQSAGAPSRQGDGHIRSAGGLKNAIRGVAAGEQWSLRAWVVRPGHTNEERIDAEFRWDEAPEGAEAENIDAVFGRKPSRLTVHLDLVALFSPLLPIVGQPDAQ